MKVIRTIALLALSLVAIRCEANDALSHTKPEVIDDLSILDPGKVVSAAYLFDSVVTNGGDASRGKAEFAKQVARGVTASPLANGGDGQAVPKPDGAVPKAREKPMLRTYPPSGASRRRRCPSRGVR